MATVRRVALPEWFHQLSDGFWLLPDEVGEEEARFLKRALRLRQGHRVLDAPSGAGRVAVHLALAGCDVTGVDIRRTFIARAQRRFRAAGVSGTLAVLDIREIESCCEFHGIFNWGGSFGYFGDDENADLIRRFAKALRPGGRLLIDLPNRARILRRFKSEVVSERGVARNRWNRRCQRLESSHSAYGRHRPGDTSSIRLYTPAQTQTLFTRAGLRIETMYGDWRGSPYSRSSERLIVVGRKTRPAN